MPTFETTPRFDRDFKKLTAEDRARFLKVVWDQFIPDLAAGRFRPGLRVKRVQGAPGVYEMTWAPDGRATWQYGPEQQPGTPHVIWRRVGTHAIFDPGPP
ncbi:hypothetical protein LI90_3286 [Carbonactinospora thermoautotrophica]|uniref:Cytotoxic translational repressor of toxin-antitoxin stability system n=1 Tax=Carbonactinospora thermoautotrophica TaxID=1469144 RepID=A0A132MWM8_9ACTN|nr:hypothetical protein [Carbonactinospora thermoautotrophica]KWX02243.1 hypothetical protein LI90_3286 [Carbonactinospora thermoautotrophica]